MAKLFTYKFLIASFVIAALYIVLTIYLMNFRLVRDTILGNYPFDYKGKLLVELLGGMWTSMTGSGVSLLIVISIFTGANVSLLVSRVRELRKQGHVRFIVGGSSLLGIIGSGCAACGLPILTLLGLSGSVAYLPLKGMELSYISLLLLVISFYLLVRTNEQTCSVNYIKT